MQYKKKLYAFIFRVGPTGFEIVGRYLWPLVILKKLCLWDVVKKLARSKSIFRLS